MIRELSDVYRFFVLSPLIFFAPQKDPEHSNYWALQFDAGLRSRGGALGSILTRLKQKAPTFQFRNGLPIMLNLPRLVRKWFFWGLCAINSSFVQWQNLLRSSIYLPNRRCFCSRHLAPCWFSFFNHFSLNCLKIRDWALTCGWSSAECRKNLTWSSASVL